MRASTADSDFSNRADFVDGARQGVYQPLTSIRTEVRPWPEEDYVEDHRRGRRFDC
jgi:hypothetical protein